MSHSPESVDRDTNVYQGCQGLRPPPRNPFDKFNCCLLPALWSLGLGRYYHLSVDSGDEDQKRDHCLLSAGSCRICVSF